MRDPKVFNEGVMDEVEGRMRNRANTTIQKLVL